MTTTAKHDARANLARKVRGLREQRRWTQVELSRRLGLSQSRLSEIEGGQGSFTAEQFLTILKLFNVSVNHFATATRRPGTELQNTLARLGAIHLQESPDVLPSDLLEQVGDVVREVLVTTESPRHVTSLAPVLVRNIDRTNLKKLHGQLIEVGLERRLGWLIENTLVAVRQALSGGLPRRSALAYRRAEVILDGFLRLDLARQKPRRGVESPDVLDADILSTKSLEEVQAAGSVISRRWSIATSLQLEDFIEALRASRVAR